jgi:hypothetical protein
MGVTAVRPVTTRTRSKRVARQRRTSRRLGSRSVRSQTVHAEVLGDIQLAQHNVSRPRKPNSARRGSKTKRRRAARAPVPAPAQPQVKSPAARRPSLSQWLSLDNLQDSLKTVGNLRNVVRNCLQYLQQADQVLETLYVTSTSLKETGVLDKLVKHRGKNLTTDDFTNILIALMNSPVGNRFFKALNSQEETGSQSAATPAPPGGSGPLAGA